MKAAYSRGKLMSTGVDVWDPGADGHYNEFLDYEAQANGGTGAKEERTSRNNRDNIF